MPRATCIDVSAGGLLIAFDEPIGFPIGHRLVVSLDLPGGQFHVHGAIVRIARGDDFHTYAAIELLSMSFDDFAELTRQIEYLDRFYAPLPG